MNVWIKGIMAKFVGVKESNRKSFYDEGDTGYRDGAGRAGGLF